MPRKLILILLLGSLYSFAAAQTKTLGAVKTIQAPQIDGDLSDAAWQQAPIATDFIQNSPDFGRPASVRTTVRILYDNSAVYIGAYLHDMPSAIRQQITSRDGESRQDVDYFSVFFDTYNDQQNGFQFLITPANVQTDAKLNPNANSSFGDFGDKTWDAVWESSTSIKSDGWVVEMRIPYISLRFAKKDVQTWGLQFLRFTRRNNESSYWNPVDPNTNGFVNQFGKYNDLTDIQPPLRLSFSPYLSGGVRFNPPGSAKEREWLRNGGMDVKYGINESFTLDATLIPDFGQVVSDNVVNNLSPFEINFQENRQFFKEGTEIFNKSGLFYSRRVGAIPSDYYTIQKFAALNPQYEIQKNPAVTQLYNALKFSGRTKGKLGIGIFNAVTAPMEAELYNRATNRDTSFQTEPLTNYNIIVLDQALKNRSSITFTNTNVMRSGSARDANVSAFDWSLYTKSNNYQFRGTARYSKIFGYTPFTGNINLNKYVVTRNNDLYYEPYDGFNTSARFGKVSGKIQFSTSVNVESNGFDPNDLGYIQAPNEVGYDASVSYNQLTATDKFIMYRFSLNAKYLSLYDPNAYNSAEYWTTAFWIFRNFWDITLNVGMQPKGQHDYFELRTPNRFLQRPSFYYVSVIGSTDSRKRLFFSLSTGYNRQDIQEGHYYTVQPGVRYRFSNRFSLSLNLSTQEDRNQVGYAFLRETNGEPIIGYRRNRETSSILSGVYNFTPRLNLTFRTRHYWNQVRYKNYFNVATDGSHIPRPSTAPPLILTEQNYNLFNVDAFVTWDFRLGSRVIFGWKNWIGNPFAVGSQNNYLQNLKETFNSRHGNELTLKVIYFLDYNQLRRK